MQQFTLLQDQLAQAPPRQEEREATEVEEESASERSGSESGSESDVMQSDEQDLSDYNADDHEDNRPKVAATRATVETQPRKPLPPVTYAMQKKRAPPPSISPRLPKRAAKVDAGVVMAAAASSADCDSCKGDQGWRGSR